MEVICLEEKAFYALIEQVVERLGENNSKPVDRWIDGNEVMQVNSIKEELTKNFSSKIKLNYKHDSSLIGGLIVQVESTMVDTSIKNKLQQIEKRMIEA